MSLKSLFVKTLETEQEKPVIKKGANFITSEQYDRRVSEQNPYPAFGLGGVGTMFKPNSDVIKPGEDINSSELFSSLIFEQLKQKQKV